MSGRALDSPRPFPLPSKGVKRDGLGAAEVLAFGLSGPGLLREETLGSPATWGGEAGEVPLTIIPERRSLEDEPC